MLQRPPCRFALCLLASALLGCSTAKTVDVLESRLRHQEDMLANYEAEMKRVKSELSVTRREAEDLRVQLADSGQPTVPAEESGALFRAAGIRFSALMSGGAEADGQPGHDGLSVVLVPHDHDGELVKLPGSIEIEAFDLSQPGGAQRVGHWSFDQRDIHNYWHKGVIQSGYQFELPWQSPPTSEKMLLVGHLTAADGRKFDTTLTVTVDPPADHLADSAGDSGPPTATERDNPFAVRQAAATSPQSEIIWADGEGPADESPEGARDRSYGFTRRTPAAEFGTSPFPREGAVRSAAPQTQGRSMTGSPFSGDLNRTSPVSVRSPNQSTSPQASEPSATPSRFPFPVRDPLRDLKNSDRQPGAGQPVPREVPPPIEDWWADDEWATDSTAEEHRSVRTSDSFTDETIPQYR